MRTPTLRALSFAASIALAACSPGRVIIVRQPAPPPPPPAPRIEPLEITVARPVRGHLLVQTNRPSYVALFEIVPDRGVALLAPAYAHQRTWMLAGLNWVPVSWKMQSAMYYGPPSGRAVPARWVYAIASDEPLRLPDDAFHPAYMRRVLGPAAYRGTNPYLTMRAIARAFVPSVVDEMWAEDAYALAATYVSDPYRTVRIYCANRTMYEVPEELADRAWCPVRTAPGGTIVRSTPARPDSIVATNGQRLRRRLPETTPVRAPIDRVREPTPAENAPVANDNNGPKNNTTTDVKDVADPKDVSKERRGNGNAYGHTDDPNVKGRGIENEKRDHPRTDSPRVDPPRVDPPRVDPPRVDPPRVDPPRVDRPTANDREPRHDRVEVKQEKQEEKPLRHEEKPEDKQQRREEKQDEKADKVETKPEKAVTVEPPRAPEPPFVKPEDKPDKKDDDRTAKPEDKPQQKSEPQAETKEEKVEAKTESKTESKSEDKPAGKPEEKQQDKPDSEPPGKKDRKGKP